MVEELPYDIELTKRLVVPAAEDLLYQEQKIDDVHSITLVDYMGGDDMVERVATAGHGRNIFPEKPDQDIFLDQLVKRSIFQPFKFPQVKLHIKSSIADALHIVYDQRASVNEYSGRYSVMIDSAFLPTAEYIASRMEGKDFAAALDNAKRAEELFRTTRQANYERYTKLVGKEIDFARELARTPLEINNDTVFFWKTDLYSLMSFIQEKEDLLGSRNHTLLPFLDEMRNIAAALAPNAYGALESKTKIKSWPGEFPLTYPRDDEIIDSTPLPAGWKPSPTKRIVVPELEEILFVKQKYLEHGAVQAVDYIGGDRGPVESARTSYGKGTARLQEDKHLTKYLYRHRHTTPFEMDELAIEGKTPIFVDPRQGGRHRTLDTECFMGERLVGSEYFVPGKDQLKHQDRKNRQGRGNELDDELKEPVLESERESYASQITLVAKARELGVDEGTIRNAKGVGFYTFTSRTGDLHNWCHFLGLRWDPHAQKEIYDFAAICADFIKRQSPTTFQSLLDYRKNAVNFSDKEKPALAALMGPLDYVNIDNVEFYKPFGLATQNKETQQWSLNREGEELKAKLQKLKALRTDERVKSLDLFLIQEGVTAQLKSREGRE